MNNNPHYYAAHIIGRISGKEQANIKQPLVNGNGYYLITRAFRRVDRVDSNMWMAMRWAMLGNDYE